SLKVTSALSVALVVLFVMITADISVFKLFSGDIHMPRLLPMFWGPAECLNLHRHTVLTTLG
ncbi:hypothetical protein KI387_039877, partial [Taxus chinensis]